MIVFINGRFVPEEQAVVSVFDRGFLYGEGLFEATRILNARPFRWQAHLTRLQAGLEHLKIKCPFEPLDLRKLAAQLIAANKLPDALLRITISRGVGRRGYSPAGAESPTLVMTLHAAPPKSTELPQWRLITSTVRLPANEPLAGFKTCAKLPQILARAEADAAGANDAILLNTDGFVVEGSSSNLFWIKDGVVNTSPSASGILPGVTRSVVFELCKKVGTPAGEVNAELQQLINSDGAFLSLSSIGIVECASVDGIAMPRSKIVSALYAQYEALLESETSREA